MSAYPEKLTVHGIANKLRMDISEGDNHFGANLPDKIDEALSNELKPLVRCICMLYDVISHSENEFAENEHVKAVAEDIIRDTRLVYYPMASMIDGKPKNMKHMKTIENAKQFIALNKIKSIINEVLEKSISERTMNTYSSALTRIYNICLESEIK